MPINTRFNLPSSVNARNFIAPAIERAQTNVTLNTPVPSTQLNVNFNTATTVIQENKFMKSLNRLQEPISRLQDLGNNCAGMVKDAITQLNPINAASTLLASQVTNQINQVSSKITNTLKLPVVASIAAPASTLVSVSNALSPIKSTVSNVFNTGGLNLGNSTIGLAAGDLLMCGVLSALMKIDINSLLSQMLQMQRTALAKLDKAISDIINVVKKPLDELASLIPEVNIPEEIEKLSKMLDNAYKSVVAQISKFTNKLNNVLQKASDCLNALNSIMGMVGLLGGLFGLSNVFQLRNVQQLKDYNNLGNISNVQNEIGKVYPELIYESMKDQTKTNREVANKDLDTGRDQCNEELEKQRDEFNNQAAQDILDPSFDEYVNNTVESVLQEIQKMINDIYQLLDVLDSFTRLPPNDPNYISIEEFAQIKEAILDIIKELEKLLELIEKIKELPDSNRQVIQENTEIMNDLVDQIKEEVNKTLDEQQQNLNEIYDELESNADSVDSEDVTEEPVDTSCKT